MHPGHEGKHALPCLLPPSTHLDGLDLLVELLVNLKGLFKEAEFDRLVSNSGAVEVVQAVDEVLDLRV